MALTIVIIVLVGLSSFGLGRLSVTEEQRVPLQIIEPQNQQASVSTVNQNSQKQVDTAVSGGQVVASKNGSKYHFPWCSGAKSINEANKIWFNSPEDARKAGYTPASNCKGLK